jgi:hypothetical protein
MRSHTQQITQSCAGLQTARDRLRLLDSLFADEALAAEISDVRDDAYANLFAHCHVSMLGPRLNEPDQRWLVVDTAALRSSRAAQIAERLQGPHRRFERDVLFRQVEVHREIIRELEETVRLQGQTLEHFEAIVSDREAAVAERDAQLAERDAQLAERDAQLAERDAQLAERDAQLALPPGSNGSVRQPVTPLWWKAARSLTPPPLRHRVGVLAHREILPRLTGPSDR